MEKTCRGYMIASTLAYIDQTYDEATRTKILDGAAPQAREVYASLNNVNWYPVSHASDLFRGIVAHHRELGEDPDKVLVDVGRSIATSAMSTFLRLLMKLMTPTLFAAKATDFWSRDNRAGMLRTEIIDTSAKRHVLLHEGIGGYVYIAGVAPGFILAALDAIGCKNVRFSSDWTTEKPDVDVARYDFRWD